MTTQPFVNLRDGVVDMTDVDGPFHSDGRYVRVGELPSEGGDTQAAIPISDLAQMFQIAEMEYAEQMAGSGVLFDPNLSVEYALRIVLAAIGDKP